MIHGAFLCLVDLTDGCELILMSFLTPVIKKEWNLLTIYISILTSLFYLGATCGSMLIGKVADVHGRRPGLIISTFLILVNSVLFYFC